MLPFLTLNLHLKCACCGFAGQGKAEYFSDEELFFCSKCWADYDPNYLQQKVNKAIFYNNGLIVHGYIHRIQVLLANDNVIPDLIYSLCSLFYIDSCCLLWKRSKHLNNTDREDSFFALNPCNKKKSIINLNNFKKQNESKYIDHFSLCHIPNISQIISNNMTKGGIYHGIFGSVIEEKVDWNNVPFSPLNLKSFPVLILYSPTNNNVVAKYEYKSNSFINCWPRQFMFCYHNNIIIYEYEGKMYQLNLKNLNTVNDIGNFQLLKQNNPIFVNSFKNNSALKASCLKMAYLPKTNSIFAIQNEYRLFYQSNSSNDDNTWPFRTSYQVNCGIFNIDTNNWTSTQPYEYLDNNNSSHLFSSKTCYDDVNDCIYIKHFTEIGGQTAKYDCNKNQWFPVTSSNPNAIKLWCYNGILYGLTKDWELHALDTRYSSCRWKRITRHFISMPKDNCYCFNELDV